MPFHSNPKTESITSTENVIILTTARNSRIVYLNNVYSYFTRFWLKKYN